MVIHMRVPLLIAKWLGFLLAGFVILVMALIAERLSWLPHSLAPLSGEMSARGARGPIKIVRDRNDVPHISGTSEEDVYFGLGFAHAQDRLWQMAFTRRLLQGRLSELVGASALKPDQLARALDLEGRARASLLSLSPHAHLVLEAYAAGVNAWVEARRTNLPPEFHLLFTGFEPWLPEHSLLILKFLGIGLSGNPIQEIQHARLIKLLGAERAAELFPPYPNSEPIALRDALALEHAQSLDPFLVRLARFEAASNNWVVAGRFTKSGKPLLANDPHLGLSAPGVWYLAHLAFPSGNVVGGTIAGIPTVVLGHNDHLAWGFTTTHADTEDLVFEALDPADETRYLTPHGSEPFVSHQETIKVRFGAAREITVRESRHGPILPPVFKSIDEIAPEGTLVALAAAALSRDDTSFDAGLTMIGATDISALMPGLALYQAPMQNMVFADTEGHIGFAAPARVPMRGATAIANGLTPADGKLQDPLWTGFVPFAELPHMVDPPSGKVWTANNKIVPDDYPHLIAGEWPSPYRAHRIGELLSRGAPYDTDDFVRMQMDNLAPEAALLLPRLLAAPPAGAREAEAVKRLAAWDHDMRAEAPEPLIFTSWIVHLQALLVADDLGKMAGELRAPNEAFLARALAPGKHADWCDDTRTKAPETCDTMIARALSAALAEISRSQGSDIAAWRWDRAHVARHSHGVFGSIPLLSKFFNRELPVAGGANTLNRGDMGYGGARPYVAVHGSGLRAVYDLADLSRSRFMIALGQSGNPLSPYYDHFLRASARGLTIEIPTDPAIYAQGAIGTWTVSPSAK
jgi:penicillin amidase